MIRFLTKVYVKGGGARYISNNKNLYNVLHKRVGHTSESATLLREQLYQLLTIMDQPRKPQLGYSEGKISLAILAI